MSPVPWQKKGKRKEKIKTSSPAYDLGSPVASVCVNISLPACEMELSKTIKVAQSVSLKDRQTEEMKRSQTETSCIAMEMMYGGHTEGFLQTIHPSIHPSGSCQCWSLVPCFVQIIYLPSMLSAEVATHVGVDQQQRDRM